MAPAAATTEVTVGGGSHELAAVVKLHTSLFPSALPYVSCAAVDTVAVYIVPAARLLEGVSVKIVLVTSCVTVPTTPGATVKSLALIVATFIGSLNVAVTTPFGQVVVDPAAGVTATIVGGGWHPFAAVVKVHAKFAGRKFPNVSSAPVVIVAVYVVPATSIVEGVSVKMLLLASCVIVPVTPGASVNVFALIEAVFIAWLNVAVMTAFGHAVVDPSAGVNAVTAGGGLHPFAAVVNVQL
jgi:hypothetical protein